MFKVGQEVVCIDNTQMKMFIGFRVKFKSRFSFGWKVIIRINFEIK